MRLFTYVDELATDELHEQHRWLLADLRRLRGSLGYTAPEAMPPLIEQIDFCTQRCDAVCTELRIRGEEA